MRKHRGITTEELLFLMAVLCGLMAGLHWGMRHMPPSGIWHVLGPLGTGLAGLILGILAGILIWVGFDRLEYYTLWRRGYPPKCENGTCTSEDYTDEQTPEEIRRRIPDVASNSHRCKCGNLYIGGCDGSLRSRWLRILPDGTVRPYLKHSTFGPWVPDDDGEAVLAKCLSPSEE